MRQIWLNNNRRVELPLLVLCATMFLVSSVVLFKIWSIESTTLHVLAIAASLTSLCLTLRQLSFIRTPRIAYEHGTLLIYLRYFRPIRLPLDVVEVFFKGQGPAHLKVAPKSENTTIVVRIAEAAKEWQKLEVRPVLGHWCEGYITIRGSWCEPIDVDLIRNLNQRLIEAKRAQKNLVESTA